MAKPRPRPALPKVPLAEWASLHTHLMWVYDGPVDPHGRGQVVARDLTAWLLRRGSVVVRIGGAAWRAKEGEWLFPRQGERVQEFSSDAHILSVRFRAKWPTGDDFYSTGLGLKVSASKYPELAQAAEPLAQLVQSHFPRAAIDLLQVPASLEIHLRLQTLYSRWFEAVVSVLSREGMTPSRIGKIDPRLLVAVRRLDLQPLASPLPESALAETARLSVSQLNRLFLRQFGVSSRGYFERRRLQHAVAMLESAPETVKEISYDLGFSSLAHFSAWFKRRIGMSPREFRQASTERRAKPANNR